MSSKATPQPELLDVLDSSDQPTAEIQPRNLVHKLGLRHQAAHVWIINSRDELLIQRRAPTKKSHPNLWDISVAGHVSAGDTPLTAALREITEEIGIIPKPADLKYLFTVTQQETLNQGTYLNREFQHVYLVHLDLDLSRLKLQTSEVSQVKYIPVDELKQLVNSGDPSFVPHPQEYAQLFTALIPADTP